MLVILEKRFINSTSTDSMNEPKDSCYLGRSQNKEESVK